MQVPRKRQLPSRRAADREPKRGQSGTAKQQEEQQSDAPNRVAHKGAAADLPLTGEDKRKDNEQRTAKCECG
jgi:hypothetical protein